MGLVGAAIIGVVLLLRRGSAMAQAKWYGKNFWIQGDKLFYKVEVVNPASAPVLLNNVLLDIYKDEFRLGNIFFNTPTNIPGNGIVSLNLPVSINYAALVLMIADLTKSIGQPISLRVSGSVKINNIPILVEEKINIKFSDIKK